MDLITRILRPVVEIEKRERLKTFSMFFYFLMTISMIYVMRPVRSALFLSEYGADMLRFAYIGEGLFLIFVVSAYSQLAKRISRKVLYQGVLLFFITNLVAFWILTRNQVPHTAAVFYIWQGAFSAMITMQFWMLTNDLFNTTEAKRLFGFIISGGSVGGIIGGILTSQLVRWIQTEDLFLVTAIILFGCFLLVRFLWPYVMQPDLPRQEPEKVEAKDKEKDPELKESLFSIFKRFPYLFYLAGLIVLAKMSATIVDNQFNGVVENAISGKEAMTAFFGNFWAALNFLTFFMQLFVISASLRYLGVGLSIWILPVGLLLLSGATFLYPILWLSIFYKMFDGSANYSIQQASREVLYLPVPSAIRRRVKPFIDVLGYRGAKALGGAYIALFAPILAIPNEKLGLLVIMIIPVWFLVAWLMRNNYSKLLRDHLRNRKEYEAVTMPGCATDVLISLYDEKDLDEIKRFMSHRSTYARKLAATAHLAYARESQGLKYARQIVDHMAKEEAMDQAESESADVLEERDIEFLKQLLGPDGCKDMERFKKSQDFIMNCPESVLMKIGVILRETEKGLESKRRAVRVLERIPMQESADLIMQTLAGARDHAFRFILIRALNHLYDHNPKISINRFMIKNEISREVRIHERLRNLHRFYMDHRDKNKNGNYLGVALKALEEESLERIFQYLDILYPHEVIHLIYERLVESSEKDSVRAHALELLNNTLEPAVLIMVRKVLESGEGGKIKESEVLSNLKHFMRSEDRWFSLISAFLLSELELGHRWPELEKLQKELGIFPSTK